jgi:hypothetical protein
MNRDCGFCGSRLIRKGDYVSCRGCCGFWSVEKLIKETK